MLPERPLRILIIDDDRADREIYKRCLQLSPGWQTEFAEADSAVAGLEKGRAWLPDCILLDYNLPDRDGLEVVGALRAAGGRAPCAIVMLTAFGGEELAVRAMKAGVTDYLPKGRVAADTLPHTVINAIEKWRMQWQIEVQQSELQKSAHRHQLLLEAIPQMVWMATADGRVEYANRRWSEYTGLRLEDATRFGWDRILHPEDRERTFEAWGAAGPNSIFEIEHRLRRAQDGAYRWHLVRAAPLTSPGTDEIISWFGTCTDTDDQKQLESDKRERQKLESIGRLAGGVAHDFNNLLVAILGGASLAMDSLPASHPAQKLLAEVLHAGERAAQLTRQMLAYAGKSNLFVEPVDIGQLVRETCTLIGRSLPNGVQLKVQIGADVPAIETDLEQMRQAVSDVVTNAVEAVGQSGGTVEVRTEAVETIQEPPVQNGHRQALGRGTYVVFEVSDTGCGMNEEIRQKIFDPFFTTKSTGRGLGLAAVQGFVRSNQGAIEIDSTPGQGTRFRVILPAAREVVRESLPPAQEREQEPRYGSSV